MVALANMDGRKPQSRWPQLVKEESSVSDEKGIADALERIAKVLEAIWHMMMS